MVSEEVSIKITADEAWYQAVTKAQMSTLCTSELINLQTIQKYLYYWNKTTSEYFFMQHIN